MGAAPFRGTFSPSARGEGKWRRHRSFPSPRRCGRHRSFPLAPRQRGEGARRAGEGWSSLQRSPSSAPAGHLLPVKNGEKGNGGGTVPGHLLPVARGEGKWGAAPFFPLAPRQRGEGARRAGEGLVELAKKFFFIRPSGAPSPRQHGEKGNGSRVPALACPSFSSTWEAYTTSLGKTKRYPTPISVERLFEMRRVCGNW